MNRLLDLITSRHLVFLAAALMLAAVGWRTWKTLPVDVFPDIPVPRVTLQTEAGGLTAEEVEQLVTIPIETAMSGIPGLSTVRSSSGGGLSFVWLDFDWSTDLARARFDVFERLSRVKESLPAEVETEIVPLVSVTGEIMLVALTAETNGVSSLELRELAEYDLRQRLLGVPGIGEVAVVGGRLPEYRVAVDPRRLAQTGLAMADVIEAARDTRTSLSAGYLAHVAGEEVPIRQLARADSLEALRASALPLASGGALKLSDVAEVSLEGAPRRGSASFEGREAVVLSVQKTLGGNTPELTRRLDGVLAAFGKEVAARGVRVHANAYRQADFIAASIAGGRDVLRDAVIVVIAVLLLTLLELRTILVVLVTMPISILAGLALFPALGLGVNVMTLGGFAIAAGDIVDAAIIFTEVIRRKLGENAALAAAARRPERVVVAEAAASVAPGVLFSTLIVVLVFLPLLFLDGLEGCFFRPLSLAYLAVFAMSLVAAVTVVPALARMLKLGGRAQREGSRARTSGTAFGIRVMLACYRPLLCGALRFPKTVLLLAVAMVAGAAIVAKDFGSSFLPPFREDSFNVVLSLPPGASLAESERVAEACVPLIRELPGVLSVTRRTGRAERDQHAEPVSSSEYVVRVDLKGDPDAVKAAIRDRLGSIPGCSLLVGYPIAHRIGAVLSGTEAEVAVNVYGESAEVLRAVAAEMKRALEKVPEVSDVRANREVMVSTLRIDYDLDLLREAGLTLREAGEQVAAAFNGVETGVVREGVRRRSIVVRLAGDPNEADAETVRGLLLAGRGGRCVRLDDVASVVPEEASNLMLREGGRRKALISCNASDGVDTGELVGRLRASLEPIARRYGCSVTFSGSSQARESAARRLALLGIGLVAVIFVILLVALKSVRAALLALVNVPLGLVGGVVAVAIADSVLSVSSLVGFVTVMGFVLRNGILLLNRYRERLKDGAPLEEAVREGSLERMVPIVMTSLTTVFGLVPIMLAGQKPGGELLAPLAVVQFGGILGATFLNLLILPALAKMALAKDARIERAVRAGVFAAMAGMLGCTAYEARPIDWAAEASRPATNRVEIASADHAAQLAIIGNPSLNVLRLKAASSGAVACETGWWEDPSVEYSPMRIVNPADYPWITDVSIGLTIPLSGVPGCERAAARAYAEADRADIVAAEAEVGAEVRSVVIRLVSLRTSAERLASALADASLVSTLSNAVRLAAAGEVTTAELSTVRRNLHARRHQLQELRVLAASEEASLRRLLGFDPRTEIAVRATVLDEASALPPDDCAAVDLVRHPRVQAALRRLDGDEAALRTEIRRQYPDLRIGPSFSREDGQDRLGLSAGVTLPLWNRNRKGVAEATGVRDVSRRNAIDVWRELVCRRAEAVATLAELGAHPSAPPADRTTAAALLRAGEIGAIDFLTLSDEILTAELSEIDWRRDVRLAREEIRRLSVAESR